MYASESRKYIDDQYFELILVSLNSRSGHAVKTIFIRSDRVIIYINYFIMK